MNQLFMAITIKDAKSLIKILKKLRESSLSKEESLDLLIKEFTAKIKAINNSANYN